MLASNRLTSSWLLFSLPVLFLVLFYFYPLFRIVQLSLFSPDPSELSITGTLIGKSAYWRILWFTTWQAGLSTILTVLLGLPAAFVFARHRFPGKNLLEALTTVPFVLPTVVTAAAFRALLGNGGLVNRVLAALLDRPEPVITIEQSAAFFILAHVFYNYALVLRIVGGYWAGLAPSLREAAQMLGASPLTVFFRITLPLLLPALGSAAILVFIFCFTSFGVVLILGGPTCATIEVEIYRQSVQLFNLPMAATLSLIQIIINFLLMWVQAQLSRKTKTGFSPDGNTKPGTVAATCVEKLFIAVNLAIMAVLLLSPLLALFIRSLLGPDGVTGKYWLALFAGQSQSIFFVQPIEAVRNSAGFACIATLLALTLGLISATALSRVSARVSTLWDAILMLPLATSAVTLGFGYIIALNRPPLNLRDSLLLVPIAHALVAFPFVLRCILPGMQRIPPQLREAAALLGAAPFTAWRKIEAPLLILPVLAGIVFAFSISMGEFGASSFVTRPQLPTMPVAIYRFLGQPGEMNYGQAMAMSSLLMLVCGGGFWLLGRLDRVSAPSTLKSETRRQ